MNEYVVEMKGIVKNVGQVQAVKHGEFTLKKGEIHSLIGENGAGKSTMMKLLYGMWEPSHRRLQLSTVSAWSIRNLCW